MGRVTPGMKSMPRVARAVPVLLLVTMLAACGAGGGGSVHRSEQASEPAASGPGVKSAAVAGSSAGGSAPDALGLRAPAGKQAATTALMSRAVISTGQISLHSTSVDRARAEVVRLVASWRGSIADEQTSSDQHGRVTDSAMTLRVPSPDFSTAMAALARIGTLEQQSRTAEDVTTKVIDTDVRVRAAQRSINEVELLLGRAKQLSDIITIESDLAQRQADLDSLKSQQAWLADQTTLSTITVQLHRTGQVTPRGHQTRGFLAGFEHGWNALRDATATALTAVGALLPFAMLVTLLGAPLWLVVRRRTAASHVSAVSAPERSA